MSHIEANLNQYNFINLPLSSTFYKCETRHWKAGWLTGKLGIG